MTAYSGGSGMASESSTEVDEFRVLGGHKAVLRNTTSSSAGSAPSTVAGSPASRILDDSDDGNSLNGQHNGAMEILHAYYGAIGMQPTPPHQLECSRSYGSYDSGVARSTYGDPFSTTEISPPSMPNDAPLPYGRPSMAPPTSMLAPEAGSSHVESYHFPTPVLHQPHAQVRREQQQHHVYHEYSQGHSQGQQWGISPMHHQASGHHLSAEYRGQTHQNPSSYANSNQPMYGYSAQLVDPTQGYAQAAQRPGHGVPIVERTQEEIWRDFMMGYQQSS
jgi:hypothetical protein